jgi:hypothetical protein
VGFGPSARGLCRLCSETIRRAFGLIRNPSPSSR